MIGKIKRSTRIAAAYVNVFGDLVAAEARQEVQRLTDRLRQKIIAVVLLLFGFIWLNVGVFVLIWDSPYRHWLPFAIGVGVALVALLVWQSSRAASREPAFAAARKALADDAAVWNIDLLPSHVLADFEQALRPKSAAGAAAAGGAPGSAPTGVDGASGGPPQTGASGASVDEAVANVQRVVDHMPEPPPPTIEELERQLRELRLALKRSISGPAPARPREPFGAQAGGSPYGGPYDRFGGGFASGFQPKSRTMRTVMAVIGDGEPGRMFDRWPVRIAAALLISGLLKRRGRWLIGAWPVIRFVVAELARARQAPSAPRAETPADAGVGAPSPGATHYGRAGPSMPPRPPDASSAGPRPTPPQ